MPSQVLLLALIGRCGSWFVDMLVCAVVWHATVLVLEQGSPPATSVQLLYASFLGSSALVLALDCYYFVQAFFLCKLGRHIHRMILCSLCGAGRLIGHTAIDYMVPLQLVARVLFYGSWFALIVGLAQVFCLPARQRARP